MKDYATLPNVTGAFPDVEGVNSSGSGATDGTPYIKQVVDDMFGARQALMNRVDLIPDGVQESASASQFLDALERMTRRNPSRVSNWEAMLFATTADDFTDAAFIATVGGINKKRWIAVGEKTADTGIWTSRGGLAKWVSRVNPAAGGFLQAVTWDSANSLAIIVGNDDGGDADILTTPDGITLTEQANPKAFDLLDVVSDQSTRIVAVGVADGADAYIITSPNGLAPWTEQANPKNFNLLGVTHSIDLNLFCAVGAADGADAYIITSPNGLAPWTEQANPLNLQLNSVASGNGCIVAVGVQAGTSPYIVQTTDGITWNIVTLTELGNVDSRSITFSPELNLFIAIADADTGDTDSPKTVFFSLDGLSWEIAYLPVETGATALSGIHAGDDGVMIVGNAGTIINSQKW